MTEKQAEEMLKALARIEQILMNIANNTVSLAPPAMVRTVYCPSPLAIGPAGGASKAERDQ